MTTPEQIMAELMKCRLLRYPMTAVDIENYRGSARWGDFAGSGWRWIRSVKKEDVSNLRAEFNYICQELLPAGHAHPQLIRIDHALTFCKRGLVSINRKSVTLLPGPVHLLYVELKKSAIRRYAAAPLKNATAKNRWF